jgi:hypothetical protein
MAITNYPLPLPLSTMTHVLTLYIPFSAIDNSPAVIALHAKFPNCAMPINPVKRKAIFMHAYLESSAL